MTKWTGLLAAAALAGCTGQTVSDGSDVAGGGIALVGTEDGLLLDGAPLDPAYRALYPNPEDVERMTVRIADGGELEVVCDSTSGSDCGETPFFTDLQMLPGGTMRVRLWDLYGTLIADEEVHGTELALSSEPGDGGEEYTPSDLPDDGTDGSDPTPPDTGLDCPRPEQKQRFCDGVNARLTELGLGEHAVDCASVGDSFDFDFPDVDWDETPLSRCRDVTEHIEDTLEDEFEAADDWCGEMRLDAWSQNTRSILISEGVCRSSPLVLDLDGNGVRLGSLDAGPIFDLLGDGEPVRTAWPSAGDAFLALDRNDNGIVDDATELFGSVTAGEQFEDGFRALATLDANDDGQIDERDPTFTSLRLWRDANQDGVCGEEELSSLIAAGVRVLSLAARTIDGAASMDDHGNSIPLVGQFEDRAGRGGQLVDVWLRFKPIDEDRAVASAGPSTTADPAMAMCVLP